MRTLGVLSRHKRRPPARRPLRQTAYRLPLGHKRGLAAGKAPAGAGGLLLRFVSYLPYCVDLPMIQASIRPTLAEHGTVMGSPFERRLGRGRVNLSQDAWLERDQSLAE